MTGKPLYMILACNCYSVPNAGKIWADDCNKFMMEHFNQNSWQCHQHIYNPCLYYLQQGVHRIPHSKQEPEFRVGVDPNLGVHYSEHKHPAAEEAWVLIHTDDCDVIGTSNATINDIYKSHNTKWAVKVVNSDFMLRHKAHTQMLQWHGQNYHVYDCIHGWYGEVL